MNIAGKWKTVRIALLLGSIAIAPFYSYADFIDWRLTSLFASLSAIVIFGWLTMMRYQPGVDLSDPFSWNAPFWPITRYPFRYWLMTSYSLILQGMGAVFASVFLNARVGLALLLLATGVALQLSLQVWLKFYSAGALRIDP